MSDPVVTVTDGAVELGGRPVLRGIDLVVRPGEVLAVLGANGSGKSTLVRAMLGLVPTCRGEVRLFGTPLDGAVGDGHDGIAHGHWFAFRRVARFARIRDR